MQKAVQRFLFRFTKNQPRRKSKAQSLVEVAIAFPILIMLFGGVVEFGFIVNYYLSLLDATRDSARYWSQDDPFLADGVTDDNDFYYQTAYDVQKYLDPSILNPSYKGRKILLDPAKDDVIVSVYGTKKGGNTVLWRNAGPYHLFSNGKYASIFTVESIENSRVTSAPNAGILVVEVHYNYHHVLNLPWMTAFIPNPLHLQAYSIMPIRSGEPK
ncbi:hypothetical protein ANAEL_04350 [Anaerolineales bacterium]|nr:hypothetical protein ANAEL_04350 [Anaerolineales bacterium]